MSGPGCTVVKNTFIEIPEPSNEDIRWRRQSSDPGATLNRDRDVDDAGVLLTDSEDGLSPYDGHQFRRPVQCGVQFHFPLSHSQAVPECESVARAQEGHVDVPSINDARAMVESSQRPPAALADGKGHDSKPSTGRRNLNRLKDNDITKMPPPWTDITTVMMRNLPNRYSQQRLLDELRESGFIPRRHFDFFYLPMDHSNAANLGYCFINFTETRFANAFADAFVGKQMQHFKSNKTVVVVAASIQGYEKNYAYYSCTRIVLAEDAQYRPLFFRDTKPSKPKSAVKNEKIDAQRKRAKGNKEQVGKGRGSSSCAGESSCPSKDSTGSSQSWPMSSGCTNGQQQRKVSQFPASYMDTEVTCMFCGQECRSGHRFCPSCGSALMQTPSSGNYWGAGAPISVSGSLALSGPMPNPIPLAVSSQPADPSRQQLTPMPTMMQYMTQAGYLDVWQPDTHDGPYDWAPMSENMCSTRPDLRLGGQWASHATDTPCVY